MNYLNPEIEALSKNMPTKSLLRPTVSCGIFQDDETNENSKSLSETYNLKK